MERNEDLKNWLVDNGMEDESNCESDSIITVCSDLIQEQQKNIVSDSEDHTSTESHPMSLRVLLKLICLKLA